MRGVENLIFVDGYDDAILGVIDEHTFPKIVYSKRAMIDILIQEDMQEIKNKVVAKIKCLKFILNLH